MNSAAFGDLVKALIEATAQCDNTSNIQSMAFECPGIVRAVNPNHCEIRVQPAFYQMTHHFDGKRVGVTKMNEAAAERLDQDQENDLPEQSLHLLELLEAHRYNGLKLVYKALDKLGQTAWKINRPIFNTMTWVWNTVIELAIPIKDLHLTTSNPLKSKILDLLRETNALSINHRNYKLTHISLKLDQYMNETFYFPPNIDFKGRAYPIPANLNHIGDDILGGLLQCADGKELGSDGLRWLKIHLSNNQGIHQT
ncbi:DNA-directed RNA polymerase [Puccinia sorghi]|uniref:DNA-directed RNA polymerase n=1 Tax=Puccinia sorghi TaxID=27349 RepID=A0A0L6UWQ9_9BASI|nr:DNA-directed RNA polymerase [Puccinia sorghi]